MSNPLEPSQPNAEQDIANATAALNRLRQKREQLTRDYAAGQLNAAQFNAMYRYYMEKTAIIERILERNPESDVWRTVAEPGGTMYLRERFESRLLYCVVFRRDEQRPLLTEGKISAKAAQQLHRLLKTIWAMSTWRTGLARKSLGEGLWLLLIIGEGAMTITVFMMQPSTLQTSNVHDLHSDFEKANALALRRGQPAAQMVFPQRSLFEPSS